MHAEFITRRVAEQVYTAWFRKKLVHKTAPVDLPAAAGVEVLDAFDPAPFTISAGEGRLMIPEKVLTIWEKREATSAMVDEFKAKHYDLFMGKSQICFASVREFLMGKQIADDKTPNTEKAPLDADDPSTPDAVAALPMLAECVSSTGKSKLFVTTSGKVYLTVQVQHGVLRGQRIFLFGGGKYKTPAEALETPADRISMVPSIDSDLTMVLFQDITKAPPEESFQTIYGTISALTAKGMMKDPLMPFHVITTKPGNGTRTIYEITPTKERIWVANRTQCSFKDKSTPPSYTTIGAAVDSGKFEKLPNELCEAGPLYTHTHTHYTHKLSR